MSGATQPAAPSRKHPMGWGYVADMMDNRDHRFSERRMPRKLMPISPRPDVRATMPAPYDQGLHGTCVLNAVGARFEQHARQMVAAGKFPKSRVWVPSRLMLYYEARLAEGTLPLDNGCMVRTAIRVMSQSLSIGKGACPERYWIYPSDGPADVADERTWVYPPTSRALMKPPATAYRSARLHQITEYRRIDNTRHSEIMQCLSEGRAIPMGQMLYRNSFYDRAGEPRPVITMPVKDDAIGGHSTTLVAANDSKEDWDMGGGVMLPAFHYLHQNSWGSNTQMRGYFAVPFDYDENPDLSNDFWDIIGSER